LYIIRWAVIGWSAALAVFAIRLSAAAFFVDTGVFLDWRSRGVYRIGQDEEKYNISYRSA